MRPRSPKPLRHCRFRSAPIPVDEVIELDGEDVSRGDPRRRGHQGRLGGFRGARRCASSSWPCSARSPRWQGASWSKAATSAPSCSPAPTSRSTSPPPRRHAPQRRNAQNIARGPRRRLRGRAGRRAAPRHPRLHPHSVAVAPRRRRGARRHQRPGRWHRPSRSCIAWWLSSFRRSDRRSAMIEEILVGDGTWTDESEWDVLDIDADGEGEQHIADARRSPWSGAPTWASRRWSTASSADAKRSSRTFPASPVTASRTRRTGPGAASWCRTPAAGSPTPRVCSSPSPARPRWRWRPPTRSCSSSTPPSARPRPTRPRCARCCAAPRSR